MSKKRKRSARRGAKALGRRRSGGASPLVWLGGILGIVVLLVVLNLLQSGVFADPPAASPSEDLASLLPLAEAKRPLNGGHDMQRIPQQTPAPQPAPEGVALPNLDLPTAGYDFGLIPKRPDVAHVFAVQNTGTADLTVTFDPDFHVTQGEVIRLVWFATNDPTQPWAEVRITAAVQ